LLVACIQSESGGNIVSVNAPENPSWLVIKPTHLSVLTRSGSTPTLYRSAL
jgi:hypothetical protein